MASGVACAVVQERSTTFDNISQLMEAQIAESTALGLDRVVERAELTREQRRQLEALGYLD